MPTKTEKRQHRKRVDAAIERAVSNDLVSDFAQQHGDYVREGNRAALNRGGTPVARWRAAGQLSETQMRAIEFCWRLWDRAGGGAKLVQDMTRVVGQQHGSGWAQQEALDELAWLKDHQRIPRAYWDVFENVCRFDMPAGTAGSGLATNRRSSEVAAQLCVRFVCDLIATWKRL